MSVSERAERLAALPLADVFPRQGVFASLIDSVKEIWNRRELLNLLVRREIKAKYKDSALGLVWSLIRPLVLLAIYYFVMGEVLGASRNITNFAVYIYSGLAVWSLFQEAVSSGTASVVVNSGIIKKTRLPREILPLTSLGVALFNFAIQLVILIVFVLATTGFRVSINFLHFPLAIILTLVWAAAFALLLSAANVYLRDVQYLTEVTLMVAFYASPIIYPWTMAAGVMSPLLQNLYLLNPMTLAVMGTQFVAWNTDDVYPWPSFLAYRMLAALLVGLVFLFFAQRAFGRMQRNFAQEL